MAFIEESKEVMEKEPEVRTETGFLNFAIVNTVYASMGMLWLKNPFKIVTIETPDTVVT